MQIIVALLLIMSMLTASSLYSRKVGPGVPKIVDKSVSEPTQPVSPPSPSSQPSPPSKQISEPVSSASKDIITKQLDALLLKPLIDDAWHNAVDNLVFDLSLLDRNMANDYLKKIYNKSAQIAVAALPSGTVLLSSLTPQQRKTNIMNQLDTMLLQPSIDDAWYNAADNLIFDLSLLDRNMANAYLKKVHTKSTQITVATVPSAIPSPVLLSSGAMKQGTPPPPPPVGGMQKGTPPPAPSGAMKQGTPPPPPSGGMQKGTPPPAPGGAMKQGTPPPPPGPKVAKKPGEVVVAKPITPAVPKGPEPLSIKNTYSAKMFEKRTNEEIIELFNQLLDALGTYPDFWDAIKKEPKLDWKSKVDAVKKALLVPSRNIQIDVAKMIMDRIEQVKAEKVAQGLLKQQATAVVVEKPAEELTEADIVRAIKNSLSDSKVGEISWTVAIKGNIKSLYKINPELARTYEEQFMKLTGERKFLK